MYDPNLFNKFQSILKFIEKACWELQLWKHSTPQIMKKFLLFSAYLSASCTFDAVKLILSLNSLTFGFFI